MIPRVPQSASKGSQDPPGLTQLEEGLAPTQPGVDPTDTQPVQPQDPHAPSDSASVDPSELGDDLHADAESDTGGSDWDSPSSTRCE